MSLIILEGCNSQTLDLDNIDFNGNPHFEKLKISKVEQQKGHWVLDQSKNDVGLALSGTESSVQYTLITPDELAQITFNNLPLDDIGAKLATYKDKFAFARLSVDKSKTFDLYNHLKQKLGKPDQTFDSLAYDKNNTEVKLLETNLKGDIKIGKDEYDDEMVSYPYQNVWVKGNIIYQYTLVRAKNSFSNTLVIISKEAFNDKIIFGYHNPQQDPILSKYIK